MKDESREHGDLWALQRMALEWASQNRQLIDLALRSSRLIDERTLQHMQGALVLLSTPTYQAMIKQVMASQAHWAEAMKQSAACDWLLQGLRSQVVVPQLTIMSAVRDLAGPARMVAAMRAQALESVTRLAEQLTLVSRANIVPLADLVRRAGALDKVMWATAMETQRTLEAVGFLSMPRISLMGLRPPMVLQTLADEVLATAEESGDAVLVERSRVAVGGAAIATSVISTAAIHVIRSVPPGSIAAESQVGDLPPFNLPYLTIREVQATIEKDRGQLDNPNLYDNVRIARVAKAMSNLVHSVVRCNRLYPHSEKLFKYTDQFIEACLCLTQFFGVDKGAFCQIVRWLYFIFYEGAGADNLRFLTSGLVTPDEAEVVFDVKHFRNWHCDHDIEHGTPSDISDKKRKFSALCKRYIGRPLPQTPDDFGGILLKIVQRLQAFLDLLCERLEQKYGTEQAG